MRYIAVVLLSIIPAFFLFTFICFAERREMTAGLTVVYSIPLGLAFGYAKWNHRAVGFLAAAACLVEFVAHAGFAWLLFSYVGTGSFEFSHLAKLGVFVGSPLLACIALAEPLSRTASAPDDMQPPSE